MGLGGLQGAAKELAGKQKGSGETERGLEGAAWGFVGKQEGVEEPRASEPSPFVCWAGAAQAPPQAACSVWPLAPGLLSKLASETLHPMYHFLNCMWYDMINSLLKT